MNIENNKLIVSLFGAYPPPYGGVTIHIQRLQTLLLKNGFQCIVYDFSTFLKNDGNVINVKKITNWLSILRPKGRIVHLHLSDLNDLNNILILSLLYNLIGKKIIITYHSLKDEIDDLNRFNRFIFKALDRFISHYIAVSPLIKNKLLFFNINEKKISIIPAFLPPVIKQEEINIIPEEIWNFIEMHEPIISANAFRITFYKDQDLYGIDMCIDLCTNLKSLYPHIGLVFCLPDIGDINYFNKMKEKIAENGINDNFLFVIQPYQFYPILMKSNILIRPTNTDGDAISIREALFFKIPAVASDIVPRPNGTILFKNRDINDFTSKVNKFLEQNDTPNLKVLTKEKSDDNFEKIMNLYKQLMDRKI